MKKEEVKAALSKLRGSVFIVYDDGQFVNEYKAPKSELTLGDTHLEYEASWMYGVMEIPYESIIKLTNKKENISTTITFGSDPELFFVKDGEMIPSTAVIKEETHDVTRDGFQLELHPSSNTCRQAHASFIRSAMLSAERMANAVGATVSFGLAHIVSDKVWKNVPVSLKRFGCNPTENVHESNPKRVTGLREKFRAGGGHIHTGGLSDSEKNDLPTLVKLMDIVAGNTLVLIDRDPANVTRRKNYGRAGEYRPKPYGLEYRVPSNFWLKHYVLWSLASGLIRNAVTLYRNGRAKELIELVNMKDIRDAINNNDYDLAMKNFETYAKYLTDNKIVFSTGISCHNVDKFFRWIGKSNPLSELGVLTDDSILSHWRTLIPGSASGFERFISNQ